MSQLFASGGQKTGVSAMFTLVISCLTNFQFALIHGPNIPGSYAILLFTASNPASITSPIHNWVLLLLWLHPFTPSDVISPLISSSILGTYQPGEFIFQCPIFLSFHTAHGVLKARILKWFAIPFSSQICTIYTYVNYILKKSCFKVKNKLSYTVF